MVWQFEQMPMTPALTVAANPSKRRKVKKGGRDAKENLLLILAEQRSPKQNDLLSTRNATPHE
ncbi:MAG: hypothetical protein L6365_05955 [Desulfobulbaceae bacterium]|nr:hypothetical protein [Pseudomonadota bacterium]MCG2747057.1 hypothetical protein [Desulfobulbaceae bacterium]